MELFTLGIDLAKTTFHLVGMNQRGEVVVRKRMSRTQLLHFTANLKVELIGMEACGGSHFLGRALREQGHEVRIIPAQYVKPYLKTNKNDYIDAEAIAEAVGRPTMRFVPIKSEEQLDLQSVHRVRERWVMRRTAVVNEIRGLLLERGITLCKGRRYVDAALPGILADATSKLSGSLLVLKIVDLAALRLREEDSAVNTGMFYRLRTCFFLFLLIVFATAASAAAQSDPLPSWNDGAPKKAITDFVGRVTKEGSTDFVPVEERIATFDNDGTLWTEQPMYVELAFSLQEVEKLAPNILTGRRRSPSPSCFTTT